MNSVTFNDPFIPVMGKEILECPLLDYSKDNFIAEGDASKIVDLHRRKFLLPFDVFKASARIGGDRISVVFVTDTVEECVESKSGKGHRTSVWFTFPELKHLGFNVFCSEIWIVESMDPFEPRGNRDNDTVVRERISLYNGKNRYDIDREEGWGLICMASSLVLNICNDFNNPSLYLCSRRPYLPNGKSVVWQKAREHYVFIHKTHAANRRENLGTKTIHDGPFVDRASHSRRAHFRLLSSPRYKAKRGQRIWVQSAWVGPKEWSDHSGQIYKIVDRVDGKLVLP